MRGKEKRPPRSGADPRNRCQLANRASRKKGEGGKKKKFFFFFFPFCFHWRFFPNHEILRSRRYGEKGKGVPFSGPLLSRQPANSGQDIPKRGKEEERKKRNGGGSNCKLTSAGIITGGRTGGRANGKKKKETFFFFFRASTEERRRREKAGLRRWTWVPTNPFALLPRVALKGKKKKEKSFSRGTQIDGI